MIKSFAFGFNEVHYFRNLNFLIGKCFVTVLSNIFKILRKVHRLRNLLIQLNVLTKEVIFYIIYFKFQ